MKKTNTDLIVGASILIALFILVTGVLWLKEVSLASKMVTYTVIFPQVGTLQEGDPVQVNGVKKGTVARIRLRGDEVAAVLNLEKTVKLTDSTQIRVINIGLLGERGLGIKLTSKGNQVPFNTKEDTTFLSGKFDTGISEAMGMLGTVLTEVETLAKDVTMIMESTVGDTAFLNMFHTMVGRLDTITVVAQNLVSKNEPLLNRSMNNLSDASSDLKSLMDRNSGNLDTIIANGEQLSSRSLAAVTQVESLAVSVQTVVHRIDSGEGTLGKLYKDDQFYVDLKHTLANVDSLVNEVQDDALKLRLRFWGKKKKE
ncbi:MAG: MlaD family protein [Fibrobacterota bacterium]